MDTINESINDYNKLIPFINILEEQKYDTYARCNYTAGYGFTVYATKDIYVDVCLWGGNSSVSVKRRTTKYYSDPVNDEVLKKKSSIRNIEEVKQTVIEYLEYGKTIEPIYKVNLTKSELETIIDIVDGNLKTKLIQYLEQWR